MTSKGMYSDGWIGVDLDGTLAVQQRPFRIDAVGPPIPRMVERVKEWLAQGEEVRIVTARVGPAYRNHHTEADQAEYAIRLWCKEHLGQELDVTWGKDFRMKFLYDDRAVRVETNTTNYFPSVNHAPLTHAPVLHTSRGLTSLGPIPWCTLSYTGARYAGCRGLLVHGQAGTSGCVWMKSCTCRVRTACV